MKLQLKNNTEKKKSQEVKGYLKRPIEKKEKVGVFREFMEDYASMAMKTRIAECGDFIGFLKTVDEDVRLDGGNFCNNRFCPFCSWRQALKNGYLLQILMAYINKIHQKEFIFLTLTAPNVAADKLGDEINDFNKAWKRLFQNKRVSAINKGFIRKLEVTYNQERNDYHPHFHVLLAVNRSYFKDKKLYTSRDEWLKMWQAAKRDSSITQVDIRRAKMDDFKSVLELATYSAKASDYLLSHDIFKVFYENLKGRQLITFNGLFKDTLKAFKAGDLEDFQALDENIYIYREWFNWDGSVRKYLLERVDEVSVENLDKIYKNEIEID